MIWTIVTMVALMGFVSLAIDFGRVQLDRTELQMAVDAAARYAVTGLSDSTYASKAQTAASANSCDGVAVSISSGDIVSGTWANSVFTAGGSSPNAVQVTAYRNSSHSGQIPLLFASTLGVGGCNIRATSIAKINTTTATYGVVGLNNFSMATKSYIDSYNSQNGDYTSGTARSLAVCKSNTNITLANQAQINGDAHAGIGKSVGCSNNSLVTGNTTSISSALSYADVDTSAVASSNNNSLLSSSYFDSATRDFTMNSSDSYTLPAGTYYLNDFTMKNSSSLACAGAVTIYITGDMTLQNSAAFTASGNRPSNTKLQVAGTGNDVHLKNTSSLQADLYDPHGQYNGDNNTDFYGVMMVNDVSLANQAAVHQDESISGGSSSGTGSIQLVK